MTRTVRCVVITSTHETVFSSGGNLSGFAADVAADSQALRDRGLFPRVFKLLGELGKPSRQPYSSWSFGKQENTAGLLDGPLKMVLCWVTLQM